MSKHSIDLDDFTYQEESSVVELNEKQFLDLQSQLEPSKKFILKDNLGNEVITRNTDEVMQLLKEKNISEVLVEEVSTDNAKLSRIKINNSYLKKYKLRAKPKRPELSIIKTLKLPFALECELKLNKIEDDRGISPIEVETQNITTNEKFPVFASKKKITRNKSSVYTNFFRMKNNSEVFKLGKSFLQDYTLGKRCFGLTAMGEDQNCINTIYGIVSFFNFYCHVDGVVFISDNEFDLISKLIVFKPVMRYDNILDKEYIIWESEGISVIKYSVFDGECINKTFNYIDSFSQQEKVVICSLPKSKELLEKIEMYFQVLQKTDNVSFVVKKNQSNIFGIKSSISFLNNYKVKIKGIIFG